MSENNIRVNLIQRVGSQFASGFFFLLLGAATLNVLCQQLTKAITLENVVSYTAMGLCFLLCVFTTFAWVRARTIDSRRTAFAVTLVIWVFLLMDDSVFFFNRKTGLDTLARGSFSSAAYGEAMMWVVAALVLTILSFPWIRSLAHTSFAGQHKWLTLYVLLCIISSAWSPGKGYSLAWAFKLMLTLWTLYLFAMFLRNTQDLVSVLRATLVVLTAVLLASVIAGILDPADAFTEGRLAGIFGPTGLSEHAGVAFLLALILYSWKRQKWLLLPGLLAAAVMVLGGGKGAIGAAVIGASVFLYLRKQARLMIPLLAAVGAIVVTALLTAPLGYYAQQYAASDNLSTFTGRTWLWAAAMPQIRKHLVMGHGYLGSRYFALVETAPSWADHMHNAFLETVYNNGIIGLFFILIICAAIVRNVYFVKHRGTSEVSLLAVGLLAIFVDLQVDGIFRPSFGGKADSFCMLFFALLVLTQLLRTWATSESAEKRTLGRE